MTLLQSLSKVDLFTGLEEEQLDAIAALCTKVECAKGKILFREGEEAKYLYILTEGSVTIQVRLSSRPERVSVAVVNQPYHGFGWSGVVAPFHYTASSLCQEDSRLIAIEGQALMKLLEQEPVAGFIVMKRIAEVVSSRLRNSRAALLKTL